MISTYKNFFIFFKKRLAFVGSLWYYISCLKDEAVVAEWQTRCLEGAVGVYLCGFKSRRPHQNRNLAEKLGFSLYVRHIKCKVSRIFF